VSSGASERETAIQVAPAAATAPAARKRTRRQADTPNFYHAVPGAREPVLCAEFFLGAPRPFRAATLYRGAAAPPYHPPSADHRAAKRELQPERSRSGPGSRRFWSSFSFGSGPSFSF